MHKCHGGVDSLITSREAYEVATRFFHGDVAVQLHLLTANVKRGFDKFGKSEMFFGVSIKPRRVDFDLFHQSAEAENCYGPFRTADFSDELKPETGMAWAGPNRLVWEGWLDTSRISASAMPGAAGGRRDLVMRLDFYAGERDLFGVGFSDNVIFRKQYYIRAVAPAGQDLDGVARRHQGVPVPRRELRGHVRRGRAEARERTVDVQGRRAPGSRPRSASSVARVEA